MDIQSDWWSICSDVDAVPVCCGDERKVKFSIYCRIYVPTLICSHECWVMMEWNCGHKRPKWAFSAGCLGCPSELRWEASGSLTGRPRTPWRDCVSRLPANALGFHQKNRSKQLGRGCLDFSAYAAHIKKKKKRHDVVLIITWQNSLFLPNEFEHLKYKMYSLLLRRNLVIHFLPPCFTIICESKIILTILIICAQPVSIQKKMFVK